MPRKRTTARTVLVLFSTYGGPPRSVAEALVAELKTRPDVEVRMLDFFEECMPSMSVLARFAYRQTPGFFFGATGTLADIGPHDGEGALLEDLRLRGTSALSEIMKAADPAAVVSTCPIAAGAVAEVVSPGGGPACVAVVTDHTARFLWIHPRTALHFVPSRESRDDLVVHGASYDRVVVTGTPVHGRAVPPGDRAACLDAMGLPDRFTVAAAGSGALSEEGDLISLLVRSSLQVVALAGENPRALERARKAASAGAGLVTAVEELHRYGTALGAADVLVCAPGSPRIAEALAAGAPLILYNPVPEREFDNVDFLINSGAALLARDEADIAEKCRFLAAHPERRAQLARASADLGRPHAVQAVVDRLLAVV